MTANEAYEILLEHSLEITRLISISQVLGWDQRTCIPPKGHAHRAEQLALLAKLRHQRMTDPRIGEWLTYVESSPLTEDPESISSVNIRGWRRSFDKITKIPERLAIELARASSQTQSYWECARPENDWKGFAPKLERLVELKREQAQALGYDKEPYDPLLDGFEIQETAASLEPIFTKLTDSLQPILEKILSAGPQPKTSIDHYTFPVSDQEAFGKYVAESIGYDFDAGRLDVAAHPFTTGIGPGDARITTRYSETDFSESFFAVVHETGHALYHQGLPLDYWGQPFCSPISLGINESQSRMWENVVARSKGFWEYFKDVAGKRFDCFRTTGVDDIYRAFNRVEPGFIRVEADEVTYNLHVLLRFRLEREIISDQLQVKDLPEAWNSEFYQLFHMTPPDYANGVMQDVHWSAGMIGYFPTYTLGNLYSAQFRAKAQSDLGDLDTLFSRGGFMDLLNWLRENIHSQGSRHYPRDLAKMVTSEDLNPDYFIGYLEEKYSRIYGF